MKLSSCERRLLEAQRTWRSFVRSVQVGHFWVTASPRARIPSKGDRRILIIPGFTYGSGGNPLTQLVLSLVPGLVSRLDKRRDRVLDLGCGSGLLAIACARLGLERVDAMDVSRAALQATRRHAALNGVDVTPMARLNMRRRYKLVLANLPGQALLEYASTFQAILEPDGRLYTGGFDRRQEPRLVSLFYRHGLVIEDVKHTPGWKGFIWRRTPANSDGGGQRSK